MIDSNLDFYTKINDDKDFGIYFKKALFDRVYRYLTEGNKKDRYCDLSLEVFFHFSSAIFFL
jgi:hypothetical protein